MKKSRLVIEYDFDFDVFGIISSSKGYKLAWEINKRLGIHLVKEPDLTVGFKNKVDRGFPHYSFETRLNRLKLFRNKPLDSKQGKYFLIPEFPHFDYVVLARLPEQYGHSSLPDILRQIPSVELVAPIALDSLKSKTNFVF
jgi:hypothetical protein